MGAKEEAGSMCFLAHNPLPIIGYAWLLTYSHFPNSVLGTQRRKQRWKSGIQSVNILRSGKRMFAKIFPLTQLFRELSHLWPHWTEWQGLPNLPVSCLMKMEVQIYLLGGPVEYSTNSTKSMWGQVLRHRLSWTEDIPIGLESLKLFCFLLA